MQPAPLRSGIITRQLRSLPPPAQLPRKKAPFPPIRRCAHAPRLPFVASAALVARCGCLAPSSPMPGGVAATEDGHDAAASPATAREHVTHCAQRLSIAPMMDWTDLPYRQMARLITKRTVLYTEMVCACMLHGTPSHACRSTAHGPLEEAAMRTSFQHMQTAHALRMCHIDVQN